MITLEILQATCPTTPADRLALFVEPLNLTIAEFNVGRVAEFVAQWAHETQGFTKLEENLRYSAKRMAEVWPKRYAVNPNAAEKDRMPNDRAVCAVAGGPEGIANEVYSNRVGNGPPESGDGWKFRGRGACHLTFRGNYDPAGIDLGLPLLDDPDQLLEPLNACRAGGWFWKAHGCGAIEDFKDLTVRINGGTNGLAERYAYFGRAKAVLA